MREKLVEYVYQCLAARSKQGYSEDACQEVALYIFESMPQHEVEEAFHVDGTINEDRAQKMIYKLFQKRVTHLERKDSEHRHVPQDYAEKFPYEKEEWTPGHSDAYSELREIKEKVVRWALKQLPIRYQDILVRVSNGMSVHQYGDTQMMEHNAARQLHHRAKKALHLALAKAMVPPSLLRLAESDRMSPGLSLWLAEGPYTSDILCTAIASDGDSSNLNILPCDDLLQTYLDEQDPITLLEDAEDESVSVRQNEEQ